MGFRWSYPLLCVSFQLLVTHPVAAAPYIYDETVWTKAHWQQLKLPFPLVPASANPDMEGFGLVSSAGPFEDSAYDHTQKDRLAALQMDGSGSSLEQAVMGPAAGMIQCRTCHHLAIRAFQLAQQFVHMGRAESLPLPLARQLRAFAGDGLAESVLQDVKLTRQPLKNVPGVHIPADAVGIALIPQPRKPDEAISAFESEAVQQSAGELLAVAVESKAIQKSARALAARDTAATDGLGNAILDATTAAAASYATRLQSLSGRAPGSGLGPEAVLAPEGLEPDGVSCLDYHRKCSDWESQGECEENPGWMIGGSSTMSRHKGHCRLSCGICMPSIPSGLDEDALEKLEASSEVLLAELQQAACGSLASCKIHGPNLLNPGAPSPSKRSPMGQAAPSPGGPVVRLDSLLGNSQDDELDPTRAVEVQVYKEGPSEHFLQHLSGGYLDVQLLEQDVAETLGQSCIYLQAGWWTYELCYLRALRQLHVGPSGNADQIHVLGVIDAEQSAAAREGRPAVSILHEADWLPSMTAAHPHLQYMFAQGAECDIVDDSGNPRRILRSAQVKIACSPDDAPHLLVREPEQCHYDLVAYSPAACSIAALQRPQRPPAARQTARDQQEL
ncbi:hypothetical protein WJX74_004821 [Apatococcus lobatus]|uniref:ShKT domain-containing protein n=1 Tax=Apatococcus lobatus TaxID=904363 RepID=A0AAW1QW80_9CHLO